MVKKLLFLLTVLAVFCSTANAQTFQKNEKQLHRTYSKSFFGNSPATRASTDGVVFTYAEGNSYMTVGAGATTYDCAIYVPSQYAGNKIDAVAIYFEDKNVLADVKCWISGTLPTNISTGCDYVTDVTVTDDLSTTGYPCIVETGGYTIPEGGCYVGYSFSVTNLFVDGGAYPIAFDAGTDKEGGAYLRFTGGSWQNMVGQGFGNLLTMVQMSGDNFYGNAITLEDVEFKATAVKDGDSSVRLSLKSLGLNRVSSLSYTVKDIATGQVSSENTVTLRTPIEFNESGEAIFQLEAGSETGSFDKELTVTKVNGQACEGTGNEQLTATGTLTVVSRLVSKKVVEEEYTSTSCGYCPRGFAGMSALSDMYPDNFIGIAIHAPMSYEDPMTMLDFVPLINTVSGFPSARLNRSVDPDPYFGTSGEMLGIVDDLEDQLNIAAEAEVNVYPMWSEDNNSINVSTDVTFVIDNADAPYALAYVLLADGLQGSDYTWWQLNSYYGATGAEGEPYIYEWTIKGEAVDDLFVDNYNRPMTVYMVKDMVYNHVAVKAEGIENGVTGSIKAPIVNDQVQNHTMTFDLSGGLTSYYGNTLSYDKSKLKVVAMLINTETGEIVNADEKEIAAYTTGAAPTKGVNIVKMSDGTTRKVIVK